MKEKFLAEIFSHQALVHRVCRMYRDQQEDREDLFQEIIYQLWKSYPQFKGQAKISTWMYRIALNTAMASFRKGKVELDATPLEQIELAGEDPEDNDKEALEWAIRQLNDAERAIVTLYLEDLSYREIAAIVGITENYVAVRLNRIRDKIKKLLTTNP